jgi:type VI secretion system protein ImpC
LDGAQNLREETPEKLDQAPEGAVVVEQIIEPVTEPLTEEVTEPLTEEVTEPSDKIDFAPEGAIVSEQITDPVTEPITEEVKEPVVETVTIDTPAQKEEGSILHDLVRRAYQGKNDCGNQQDVEDGLRFFLSLYLGEGTEDPPPFDLIHMDTLVSSLGDALSRQMDAILHDQAFQDLERAWLSLKFLTDRVNYNENIKTEILNLTKDELLYDLLESPDIVHTVIYNIAYTREYGQFGGQPYAAIVGVYEFTANQRDLQMLKSMSILGSLAHTPFLGGVGKDFFGFADWGELGYVMDFQYILDEPRYAPFRDLRTKESSRYLGLVLPGFLSRLPYSPLSNPVDSWNYTESTRNSDTDYSWGHSQMLLALKMSESFALYRWAVNITGLDGGGLVAGLPSLEFEAMGNAQKRISTQAVVAEFLEYQLSQSGFIPLCDKDSLGMAAFYSANTVLRPKIFEGGESSQESLNYRISTMLPYMMIVNRLAHYIKVIQRENIGTWKDSPTLERELNLWINQYVTDMDSPSPSIRARRPLRYAKVEVRDDPENPGWHFMKLLVTPHFKFIGASFTLSLTGRLDRVQFEGH